MSLITKDSSLTRSMHASERTFCFDSFLNTTVQCIIPIAANYDRLLQRQVEDWDSLVLKRQQSVDSATDE